MSLFSLSLILFLIIDPMGSVRPFMKYTEQLKPRRQKMVILREMFLALGLMILFNFLGESLFQLFEISDTAIQLTSGVILFLVAMQILFPKADRDALIAPEGEPFLVPLAIPIIAGPALLASIMLYSAIETNPWITLLACLIAWAASCLLLLCSRTLYRLLGSAGLTACEKLMGIILVLLSIERVLSGITLFYTHAIQKS